MSQPMPARVETVREDFFGTTVEDPYRWMEHFQAEEARAFIAAQAAYAREYLDALPQREPLLRRISQLRDQVPILSGFRLAHGRAFYLRRDPDAAVPRLVARLSPQAEEQTLVDPNQLGGEAHTAIDWFTPSRDGRLVVYGLSPGGSENSVLHVREVETGRELPEHIDRAQFNHTISWLEGNQTFLYNRLQQLPPDAPPDRKYLDSREYLHRLGTSPEQDVPVFGRDINPRVEIAPYDFPAVSLRAGSDWAIGVVQHGVLNEQTLYAVPMADLLAHPESCAWTRVADVADGVVDFALHGDTLYLLTHRDAPRYKVVALDLHQPDLASARTIVPTSQVVIEGIAVAGEFLLTLDLDAGINRLRRFSLEGGAEQRVPLPVQGAVTGLATEAGSPEVVVQLQSYIVSPQVYRYHAGRNTLEDTGWLPPAGIDMSGVVVTETHFTARDGTRVPLTIIHPREVARNGANPTYLTGYGSYGISIPIIYQPQMLAWFERGGIYAIAHLRGGGEYGKEWHEAGRLMNKENTITDFIDAAEYLVSEGYTRPERLAGMGTSAGGIPSGGALVRRPDLWAVMVMRVAVTDNLRIQYTPGGPANVPEFGDVTTPQGFAALQLTDAYRKVRDGVAYPAVLLTTGLNDPRVVPWQAMKMTARLQAATSSGKPILMRVEEQGGHGMGSTRRQQDEELADTLAFLLDQFGG